MRPTLQEVAVVTVNRTYSILIGHGCLEQLGQLLVDRQFVRDLFVVSDSHVAPHYLTPALQSLAEPWQSAGQRLWQAVIPAGETSKTLAMASLLYDQLLEQSADRGCLLLALGGGVVGDLTGFVAATYLRGVDFIQIPTTLLAMVDASVGGKVAVDHPRSKNAIGAFHQPCLVVCDLNCLRTLPARDYRSGLAEVVKYGMIADPVFFAWLEEQTEAILEQEPEVLAHLVATCCRIKAEVVGADERETKGQREILNYGHTFAHAFEIALNYERLQHGEAVAIGMRCAAHLAVQLGLIDEALADRQYQLCHRLGLPTQVPADLLAQDLLAHMRRDKKVRAGQLRFVLPTHLGKVELRSGIPAELVWQTLRACVN